MKKEWQPSPELIEELGLDPDDYNPDVTAYRVMGSVDDPFPIRPMFGKWLRSEKPEPMSFPDNGSLMTWVATELDDDDVEDLFREIHQWSNTIWVIGNPRQHEQWKVEETGDAYVVVIRTRKPS